VKYAEEKGEYDDDAYEKALLTCEQCRQRFNGPVNVALKRASWLHFVGRAETDVFHQGAHLDLGNALSETSRDDEALVVKQDYLASMRRRYGPDKGQTIHAEEMVAMMITQIVKNGGDGDISAALQTLTRCVRWKEASLGADDKFTLQARTFLATAYDVSGAHDQAALLHRQVWTSYKRVMGEKHMLTLQSGYLLVETLACAEHLREFVKTLAFAEWFRELRDVYHEILPLVTRVLGPGSEIARGLRGYAPLVAEIDRTFRRFDPK
jgi:hypothetical protein